MRTKALPDPRNWLLTVLLSLTIALGGGGSPAPLPELALEWIALVWLVALVWLYPDPAAWPRVALGFAAALLAFPALQLIPLPPEMWRGLPNRAIEAEALGLVGAASQWMPLSLSPARTLASLLSLLVPAVVLLAAALAGPRARRLALFAIVAMTLISVVIGAGQLAGGPDSLLRFYAQSHREVLTGFQANRNAQADVLLIGLLALGALAAATPRQELARGWFAAIAAAGLVLVLGVVLTASRAGAALLAVLMLGAGAAVAKTARPEWPRKAWAAIALGVASLGGLALHLVSQSAAFGRLAVRFAQDGEPRPELWRDTLHVVGLHWPWGSGLGTFVPVFVAAEPLEAVDSSHPNRAHNDFLELALEGGLPGLALLAVLISALVWIWFQRMRRAASPGERAQLCFAGGALLLLAAHSSIDYPLRSMALASLAGGAAGIILGRGYSSGTDARGRECIGS